MDITEFIAARLAEDEAAANEVHRPGDCGCVDRDGEFDPDPVYCSCHYPARVLREVAAKRAIMGLHDLPEHYCPLPVLPGRHGQLWTPEEGPCWTLRLLASTYSDHPDYAEWLP